MVGVLVTGKITVQNTVELQPHIANIDSSTVDGTYGAEEQAVLTDLQTKVQTLLNELRANGTLATS